MITLPKRPPAGVRPGREKLGAELEVGDTIAVWWLPRRDTITALEPYDGPMRELFPKGARTATFVRGPVWMTIDNTCLYELKAPLGSE